MPRHHVNRLRAFHIFHNKSDDDFLAPETRQLHLTWEWFSSYLHVAGGIFFIIGSFLLLPQYEQNVTESSHMFLAASSLYLLVSWHDLAEICKATTQSRQPNDNNSLEQTTTTTTATNEDDDGIIMMEVGAGLCYVSGSTLLTVGSILFLPTLEELQSLAAICFISGCCLYVVGACMNVVQTYDSPNQRSLRYANLESVSFVAGSCIYICASIPYLLLDLDDEESSSDTEDIFQNLVAILYIWGSILFLLGGIMNMFRLLSVHDHHLSSYHGEVKPLNTHEEEEEDDKDDEETAGDHTAQEQQQEQQNVVVLQEAARPRPEQPAAKPPIKMGESIMKGTLMSVPSAEDLLFGVQSTKGTEEGDLSIRSWKVEENTA